VTVLLSETYKIKISQSEGNVTFSFINSHKTYGKNDMIEQFKLKMIRHNVLTSE